MNLNPIMLAALAAAISPAFAAIPEVSNVTMAQAANRRVTITYTLADAPAVVTLDIQTNANVSAAANDPGWTSIGGEAIFSAQGDVWRKVGNDLAEGQAFSGTITWQPDQAWTGADGNGFKIAANGARARVTAWPLDNTPGYMAVDITATGGADTQTYYPAADFVPGGVTNSLYKTTKLLMRKIMAKDVEWTMGSVAESGRNATRETPHQVTLTNNYYIGVFEVTQTQWQQITGYNPSNFTTDRAMRPVEKVSYTDIRQGKGTAASASAATGGVYPAYPHADSFLGLLRDRTKLDFDLPSEAQWEFSARAGHGEGYWGDGSPVHSSSNKDANLNRLDRYLNNPATNSSTSPATTTAPSEGGTAIVGSYQPNGWGLYDVHGNVKECCLDLYSDDITALGGAVNTESGTSRVIRGGCWNNGAEYCRSAYRNYVTPTYRYNNQGFRVACQAGLK
ncbi:MAG: formylglycine-generating enzyme family protein [Kiritimatiellae bacterium]|nr:formylglycine-generating enzyme family protein [Kiritimatiellia bacterium]